jgi:hypothetical protein
MKRFTIMAAAATILLAGAAAANARSNCWTFNNGFGYHNKCEGSSYTAERARLRPLPPTHVPTPIPAPAMKAAMAGAGAAAEVAAGADARETGPFRPRERAPIALVLLLPRPFVLSVCLVRSWGMRYHPATCRPG